jgi:hypothetical protein
MAVARMHKQRTVLRENMRWDRQRPITRGGAPVEVVPATGAIAGTPGTWTPPGSTPPATNQDLGGITATPTTPWTVGQNVVCGDASTAHWNGSAWAAGAAT